MKILIGLRQDRFVSIDRRYSNPASVEAGNQHGRAVIGDGGGAGPQRSMAAATTLTRRPSLQHTTQGGDSYDDHVTALT
jgi:hypothetical protein